MSVTHTLALSSILIPQEWLEQFPLRAGATAPQGSPHNLEMLAMPLLEFRLAGFIGPEGKFLCGWKPGVPSFQSLSSHKLCHNWLVICPAPSSVLPCHPHQTVRTKCLP